MTEVTNPKKSIWKRWWFWLIAVFAIFILIGIIGGENEKQTAKQQTQVTTQNQEQSEEKFGLSEQKRKEVFFEMAQAEDRATKEATKKYPTPYSEYLQVGKKYQLSKDTSLMPELEPADPTAALQETKLIPAGRNINIIKTATKGKTPWYYVKAEGIGYGWINSIALIGQFEKAESQQLDNQIELERTLTDKYKKEIAKKYNLTDEQLTKISVEGVTKHWPMPKL